MLFIYFLLILAFLVSLCFPPLLVITLPLICFYFYGAHKLNRATKATKVAMHEQFIRDRRDKVLRSF